MKNKVVIVCMAFSVWACNVGEKKQADASTKNYKEMLHTYESYVKGLDSTDVKSVGLASNKYKLLFANADTSICDSGFFFFNSIYESVERNLSAKFMHDSTDYSSFIKDGRTKNSSAPSEQAKETYAQLQANGFYFITSESEPYLAQDPTYIPSNLSAYFSASLKNYLMQVCKENEEVFLQDGGVAIPAPVFADRIAFWERFCATHNGFMFEQKSKEYYKMYLSILYEGIDNTPLIDNQNKLSDFYVDAYSVFIEKYPSLQTTEYLKPYFEKLQAGKFDDAKDLMVNYKKQGIY